MKSNELRGKNEQELADLEKDLRDQLVRLQVAKATQRARNTATFARIRKDIARIKTVLHERTLGLEPGQASRSSGAEGATT